MTSRELLWFFLTEHTKAFHTDTHTLVHCMSKSLEIVENKKHSEDFVFHYERTNIFYYVEKL